MVSIRKTPKKSQKMALKYPNQLKISLNDLQCQKLFEYKSKTGLTAQDIIRKALDSFLCVEYNPENL